MDFGNAACSNVDTHDIDSPAFPPFVDPGNPGGVLAEGVANQTLGTVACLAGSAGALAGVAWATGSPNEDSSCRARPTAGDASQRCAV